MLVNEMQNDIHCGVIVSRMSVHDGAFLDHITPELSSVFEVRLPDGTILDGDLVPHSCGQDHGGHAWFATHFLECSQVLVRIATHPGVRNAMEVNDTRQLDFLCFISNGEPICHVFEDIAVGSIRVIKSRCINQVYVLFVMSECEDLHFLCFYRS